MNNFPDEITEGTRVFHKTRIKGNFCERCHKMFEEGDTIFTPQEVASDGSRTTRYFCGYFCLDEDIRWREKIKH